MAEDCVDHAATLARLPERPCVTQELRIHGYHEQAGKFGDWRVYGADATTIQELSREEPALADRCTERCRIARASRLGGAEEMARTVEDVLRGACRALFLNADEAIRMAPAVAALLARELGWDDTWQRTQLDAFESLARGYQLAR